MIKTIRIRTNKDLVPTKIAELSKLNKKETIALTTSIFEDVLLKEDGLIIEGFQYNDNDIAVKVIHEYDLILLNRTSIIDLIKALKDGDVSAKKRLLKELEVL